MCLTGIRVLQHGANDSLRIGHPAPVGRTETGRTEHHHSAGEAQPPVAGRRPDLSKLTGSVGSLRGRLGGPLSRLRPRSFWLTLVRCCWLKQWSRQRQMADDWTTFMHIWKAWWYWNTVDKLQVSTYLQVSVASIKKHQLSINYANLIGTHRLQARQSPWLSPEDRASQRRETLPSRHQRAVHLGHPWRSAHTSVSSVNRRTQRVVTRHRAVIGWMDRWPPPYYLFSTFQTYWASADC